MFDLIRKTFLWSAWDRGIDRHLSEKGRFQLKNIQDLAVYDFIKGSQGKLIAEIGGGASRILPKLAPDNTCFNVEKFQGADGGPADEIKVPGVQNVQVFLGEFSSRLQDDFFDVVFSVSVVEHVETPNLATFLNDGLRILKPGGLWIHAIDLYLSDEPSPYWVERFEAYRAWMKDTRLTPVGDVYGGPFRFTCDLATNPDNVMYNWGKQAPSLIPLRKVAQNVSVFMVATKN
ncbi:methyltransferase domain-containing protein [Mesorhizobium sp. YR577]|uniref:methyltransferase domain-containing protein n=1 Tax=Mesorhizobium sp. YR577 TaxID=1884373 RepID=UPI0008DFF744|nr:methyltransferase domain-containing protein [Mesorhizobium sp. YR577]SFU20215.1 Methyltransferase domain-containing protein [Mesorhizobium sp. YR577]